MGDDRHLIGRLVAGAGGAMLVVSVFLTWYSLSLADVVRRVADQLPAPLSSQLSGAVGSVGGLTLSWSGWHSVHGLRFVLLLIGAAVLVSSLARPATAPRNQGSLVLAGGLLAGVLPFYRLESPPGALNIAVGPFQFPSPVGASPALSHLLRVQAGPWVALLGGALVALGGWSLLGGPRTASTELTPRYPMAATPPSPTSQSQGPAGTSFS